MKLAVRIFGIAIAVAGLTAASMSTAAGRTTVSHQAAQAGLPIPTCGPTMGCTGGK